MLKAAQKKRHAEAIKRWGLLAGWLLVSAVAWGQSDAGWALLVRQTDPDAAGWSRYGYRTEQPDSLAVWRALRALLRTARADGYLTASADTVRWRGDTLVASVRLGVVYRWAHLRRGNLPEGLLSQIGYRERFYQQRSFRYGAYARLEDRLLSYAENHGYPFATVRLDSVLIDGPRLGGALHYDPGPYIVLDSVEVRGDLRIKGKFLSRYLRLTVDDPYSQQRLAATVRRLRQLPYLRLARAPQVDFSADRARPIFYLEKRKANQLDGVVGLLPNEQQGGRPLITGEFNLDLQNLFASGKHLRVNWRRLKAATQSLEMAYEHPALLGTPLTVGGRFSQLREDSSFLNLYGRLEVGYHTPQAGNFVFFTTAQRSRLASEEPGRFGESVSNFDLNAYGLQHAWDNLDDYFYPHRGWRFHSAASVGNKRVQPPRPFAEDPLYDTLDLRTVQVNLAAGAERYFSLRPRLVLLAHVRGGAVFNESLFINDLYRVGGLRSLRGFNENNFFAARYGIATAELRFFTDVDSYLLLFFDQGYVNLETVTASDIIWPFGAGAGLSFSTAAGIFNFAFALGQSPDQRFAFNQSKIHFGLISRF